MSHENNVWTVTGEEPALKLEDAAARTFAAQERFFAAATERDDNTVPLWQREKTTQIPPVRSDPRPEPMMTSSVFRDGFLDEEPPGEACAVTTIEKTAAAPLRFFSKLGRFVITTAIMCVVLLVFFMTLMTLVYGTITRGLIWIVDAMMEAYTSDG